jgi:K+-sensing histidine kinase KdpD
MLTDRKSITIQFDETEFRERNKDLAILLDISSLVSEPQELHTLLSKAASQIAGHFQIDAVRLYLMDDAGEWLHLAAWKGMDVTRLEKVSVREGFSGKAVRTRSFIAEYVSELANKKRAQLLSSQGIRIVICVPLLSMDRVLGVMNLAWREDMALNQDTVDLLVAIGNQIATAIDNVRLFEELQEKVKEIEEKNKTIRFFAYSVTHDLKGPSIAIHGLTKRLQETLGAALNEKGKAHCAQIIRASSQIQRLVEDLNAYIASKEAPLQLEKIQLEAVLEGLRWEYADTLAGRGVRWIVPETAVELVADRMGITRIFRNLVDNALKYGGNELTQIRISHQTEGNDHLFSVMDDGIGLPETDPEQLFRVFQRHETSRGTEGTGLGLAIVKQIAEKHGGRVWVEKGREKGVTFSFSIPLEINGPGAQSGSNSRTASG